MFNSNQPLSGEKSETKDIADDFIVHNMPKADLFAGQTFSGGAEGGMRLSAGSKRVELNDHHKTGMLIMGGGIILIGVLVYFAYIFMIKPAANPVPVLNQETPITEQQEKASDTAEDIPVPATSTESVIATSTPIIDAMPASTSTEEILPEEKNAAPVFGIVSNIDTDLDGLTDDEERMIGTNAVLADSDSDSFLDISELKSGYNPLAAAKKMDSKSPFNRYKIDSKADILFLNSWAPTYSEANKTIVFTDEDKAFIQVTFQDNEDASLPNDWYDKQFPGIRPGENISGDGWSGFYSQDSAAAYIFSNDLLKIYTISYSPLIDNDLSLPLFRLMVKTLVVK